MKSNCLDPVTIQAFLDGELPVLEMEAAAAHTASCSVCGELTRELEAEIFAISQAFEPELTLPVPTAQLRARVNAAIDGLSASHGHSLSGTVSIGERLHAWFGSLTPQMAFGSAAAVMVMALTGWFALSMIRSQRPDSRQIVAVLNLTDGSALPDWNLPEAPQVIPEQVDTKIRRTYLPPVVHLHDIQPPAPLAGETAYQDTIAQLNHSLSERDDIDLKPTMRADMERNVAILDQAILSSQDQARRNPKDPNAVVFLNTAYQNKIEFLRTVSDQAQLYASLR